MPLAGSKFDGLMIHVCAIHRRNNQAVDSIGGVKTEFETVVTGKACRLGEIGGDEAVNLGKVAQLATHKFYMRPLPEWPTIDADHDVNGQIVVIESGGEQYEVDRVETKEGRGPNLKHHLKFYVHKRDGRRR